MNIIFLEPIYKDYIWGGKKLKDEFNKNTPFERTAESWEIASNKNGICQIKNKEYKGKTLKELFEDQRIKEDLFGRKSKKLREFPILIKFIDARENLSIQVHPDNKCAKKMGFISGKNEMWYIIQCEKNGKIIGGLNTKLSKEQLKNIIENNNIQEYLKYINIKEGDSIYIPAGTIHAILSNTLVCEIQQNSDITFRVYDWNRKDNEGKNRKLHKEEAIEAIKTDNIPIIIHSEEDVQIQKLVKSKYFEVEKINCKGSYKDYSNIDTFEAINIIRGNGIIETGNEKYTIMKGESFIIPATLGEYKISGNLQFLRSYIS